MDKDRNQRLWLLKILFLGAILFVFPPQSYALDTILGWDANDEPELAGYRVYYKTGSSGDRVLSSYTGTGLVLVDGETSREGNSGFEIRKENLPDPSAQTISCRLSGLDPAIIYFFVVTAFDTKRFESSPSREVSTADISPTKPTVLSGSQIPDSREVSFDWSPGTDPVPGSGMAGYSCVLDQSPDTTPEAMPNLGLVTASTFHAPFDGYYWFHIRALDKVGQEGPNASETEHYGPICIDTGPPTVDYAFIDYVNNIVIVTYSETHMQNAALQSNYSFDNELLILGDATDVYGHGMVFSFPLDPATLDRYLIYTMTVSENITDCAGNPSPTAQRKINDDDSDGMADEYERLWFGDMGSKDGSADTDGDGVLDGDEYFYASKDLQWGANRWTLSPVDADSDHDGIADGYEIQNSLNPADASDRELDPDNNDLTNYPEYINSIVAPIIDSIADQLTVERTPYTGPIPFLSQGSLLITWSLLAGPPGMEIDPISGVVYWPEPTLDESPHVITIRAENPAGWDEKTWLLVAFPVHITVYVNASIDDAGDGNGSLESPWKSIGFALSEVQASPSLSITIRASAGRYLENITIPRSGVQLDGGWKSGFSQRWDFVQSGVEPTSEYETIIDGQNLNSVVVAGTDTAIDGFTITGGKATNGGGISGSDGITTVSNCKIIGNSADMGGGMYTDVAAVVTNCLFLNNGAEFGGGIYAGDAWTAISGCTFRGNSADKGGGIFNINSYPYIVECLFVGNTGHAGGGGIANESSYPYIANCTFSANTTGEYGGAIVNLVDSTPFITNSIVWGNEAGVSGNEIFNDPVSETYVSYCDIKGSGGSGGTWDNRIGIEEGGNIDADPLFVDPLSHDYHLQHLSPCVDAGDPYVDYSKEPQPNGGRINLGAYGGTPEATTTPR